MPAAFPGTGAALAAAGTERQREGGGCRGLPCDFFFLIVFFIFVPPFFSLSWPFPDCERLFYAYLIFLERGRQMELRDSVNA